MTKDLTIRQIQDWEKSFVKKKGLDLTSEGAVKAALCKLVEEVGEVAEAILKDDWSDAQVEAADVIIFACKVGNIAEGKGATNLSEILKEKIGYCETRTFDREKKDFDKPKSDKFH